ncbi:MAG: NAAT family transporter [Burkholderiales bacterium]|nr:NAAT family transporter [Burkholderiales bacterium]MBK8667458.1 NAAT family transporter [Burkholderiales bacterium]
MDIAPLAASFGKAFLFALAAVLPILNPPATAPVFVDLTRQLDGATRSGLARRIGVNAVLMLASAMLIGSYVLDFFGVSLPIVRISGGLIVATTAWGLLHAEHLSSDNKAQMAQSLTADHVRIQAFYPMTFPLTCGPGSIAAAITVGASLHEGNNLPVSLASFSGALTAVLLIGLLVTLTFRYAGRLLRPLGEVGLVVFLRLSAFILLCLGVQIMWTGATELVSGLTR